ncbi:MAG: thioredoxin family protein [Chitinivibrionia bacterium]|nr:thioredoxin family protein [Chitinivibrionia bacterium]
MKKIKIKAQEILFLALFCFVATAFALPSLPLSFFENESVFASAEENANIAELSFETSFWDKGDTVIVAIIIGIPENYHLYSNPKGPGVGRELRINFDDNAGVLFAKQTTPQKYLPPNEPPELWLWAWQNEAIIFIAFSSKYFSPPVYIEIEGGYCRISCIPFSRRLKIEPNGNVFDKDLKYIFEKAKKFPLADDDLIVFNIHISPQNFSLLSAIFIAFLAGIILNFMPCVLPVLGIKILSFSQNTSKKTAFLKSLAFSAGIIFVFLLLAIVAIQAKIWWGQQFQNPIFITALALFMVVGALVLFDILTLSPNSKVADLERKQDKSTFFGNFVRGICATILATPCSGPLLGAIFAWVLIDNTPNAVLAVFLAVGAGMSAPYMVLSVFGGAKISQKIGKHSHSLKKILGVILLLFAVYLLFSAHSHRILPNSVLNTVSNSVWIEFSQELFEEAQRNRQSVIVQFTARWCLNCQYNKITVYETPEIRRILTERNILALSADLTNENIEAQNLKQMLNSRSIPFMAIFDGNDFSNPIIFRDIVSRGAVLQALERVR